MVLGGGHKLLPPLANQVLEVLMFHPEYFKPEGSPSGRLMGQWSEPFTRRTTVVKSLVLCMIFSETKK